MACDVPGGIALGPPVEFGGEKKPAKILGPDEPVHRLCRTTVQTRFGRSLRRRARAIWFGEPASAHAALVLAGEALASDRDLFLVGLESPGVLTPARPRDNVFGISYQ